MWRIKGHKCHFQCIRWTSCTNGKTLDSNYFAIMQSLSPVSENRRSRSVILFINIAERTFNDIDQGFRTCGPPEYYVARVTLTVKKYYYVNLNWDFLCCIWQHIISY
jgi:hypothetical protein